MDKNSTLYQLMGMLMNGIMNGYKTDEYKKEMPSKGSAPSWRHKRYVIMTQAEKVLL